MFKCSLMGCCEKCKKSALNAIKDKESINVWCSFQETCGEYEKWSKYTKDIKEIMELADRELLESITFPDMSMERKVMQEIRESGQRKKPPFGTVPNWLVLPKRIADLSGAIIRFAESDQMNTDAVREWAQEIICHCNTMDELKKVKAPVSNAGKINRADPA